MDKTILLIDSNKNMINVFPEILKENGYTVIPAYNFELAFSAIKTDPSGCNLCILDADMPSGFKEGLNICQKLKEDDVTKVVPVFLLTYNYSLDYIELCLDAKADIVILKPFEIGYYLEQISWIIDDIELIKKGKRRIYLSLIELLICLNNNSNTVKYLILLVKAFNLIVWDKIKILVDYNQLQTMFDCTKRESKHKYIFINNIFLSEEGIVIKHLDSIINENDFARAVNAYMYFIYHFLNIVVLLTGKIVVNMNTLKEYDIK